MKIVVKVENNYKETIPEVVHNKIKMVEYEANVEHGFISNENNFVELQNWVKYPRYTSTKETLFQCTIEFYWLMDTVMGNPFSREGKLMPKF